jgi:hypothetical protein
VCEIVGGLALLTRRLRLVAGVMPALYAVLVCRGHRLATAKEACPFQLERTSFDHAVAGVVV